MSDLLTDSIPQAIRYCNSLTQYSRFRTREVAIGQVPLGDEQPIRIQSMTTTDTMDTEGTVAQSIRMIEAGCEYVRITAPSKKEAENLANIRTALHAQGYTAPLVADIHFTPNAAEIAARIVEKVRVNPGNYADKKKFQELEYTDETYNAELERIRERFTPLVLLCKEHGAAMRIGTNHGSLSDRIMSRYGDTPLGMVESAMEFLRICRDHHYHNIVLSMKASNPKVMVHAYRLLVNHMMAEGMNYPLHLGVTEAGEGEDGRIKSAVGIGALLEDGLGDTVRVSLTEEPEYEAPVAKALVDRYVNRAQHDEIPPVLHYPINPFEYTNRATDARGNIGGKNVPRVVADFSHRSQITAASLFAVGNNYSVPLDKWNLTDQACDYVYIGRNSVDFEWPGTLGMIADAAVWQPGRARYYPLFTAAEYLQASERSTELNFVQASIVDVDDALLKALAEDTTTVLVLTTENAAGLQEQRRVFVELLNEKNPVPVVVKRSYRDASADDFQLYAATDIGGLLLDGLGNGCWLDAEACASPEAVNKTAFGILQATRTRISKTEYISCPSCGRTCSICRKPRPKSVRAPII